LNTLTYHRKGRLFLKPLLFPTYAKAPFRTVGGSFGFLHKKLVRFLWLPLLVGLLVNASAQESQPLEAQTSPFDFDNYRRTPLQARQTQTAWASKDNTNLQRRLLSGERGKKQDLADRAASLFPDLQSIPVTSERAPLPTPNQLADEIAEARHGANTKGHRDLLLRNRTAQQLKLSSLSDSEYELYATRYRDQQEQVLPPSGQALLRPMPTVINSKTGGPPHGYAVSQAGIGARSEPRDNQNPFENVIRALRIDHPVTKGTDPLPAPSSRLALSPTQVPLPEAQPATNPSQDAGAGADIP
jgi:hypothetical protein